MPTLRCCFAKGQKKHIIFSNVNFLPPRTKTPRFGSSDKNVCLIAWERTQQRSQMAILGCKKFSLLFSSCPYLPHLPCEMSEAPFLAILMAFPPSVMEFSVTFSDFQSLQSFSISFGHFDSVTFSQFDSVKNTESIDNPKVT